MGRALRYHRYSTVWLWSLADGCAVVILISRGGRVISGSNWRLNKGGLVDNGGLVNNGGLVDKGGLLENKDLLDNRGLPGRGLMGRGPTEG